MKAIKMRIQKSSRPAVILLATVVAVITSMVAANATQTITTPNAAFISFNLAVGANSAPITPATNRSVLVMGCCTTSVAESVGQVSLLVAPNSYIFWVGLNSTYPAGITQGLSITPGAHIVWIDYYHRVDIEVASADAIRVHNGNVTTQTGNVTLIW